MTSDKSILCIFNPNYQQKVDNDCLSRIVKQGDHKDFVYDNDKILKKYYSKTLQIKLPVL